MEIIVNGEPQTVNDCTILDYLNILGIDPKRVAVELNLDILPKGEFANTRLHTGDKLEIVHFVGGG